ncbi:hypothetical protein CK203_074719 [Vitis vinifera]|uniref:GAG-pre-integrase domain-containing protein n=1 Tax=Vitis vinifera TaxID=29760 RepID=A0A438DLX9_VITVI|nr:hypothetical protein CK203_074719 [Vitis vinifera]
MKGKMERGKGCGRVAVGAGDKRWEGKWKRRKKNGEKEKENEGERRKAPVSSPTAINHPKTSPNIDKSTFKCTHCNKAGPTSLDIPQFQSNNSWYDQENNEELRDSKKTSTATVAEIKTEANVVEKVSALVAATDHGDIQTRQTIGCGIKRGKLYYLDLQSNDSNKLQQALMADGSEGKKKKSEIWLWHRRLGHASFAIVLRFR